jgi:uncharacterized protein with HEPN domain
MHILSEKDKDNIINIIDSIEKILKYTNDLDTIDKFEKDSKTIDAVLMNLIVIGESVSKFSDEFKDIYNEIDWKNIKGFRNIAVHDYFGVDIEEVWQILKNHIPKLHEYTKRIISVP